MRVAELQRPEQTTLLLLLLFRSCDISILISSDTFSKRFMQNTTYLPTYVCLSYSPYGEMQITTSASLFLLNQESESVPMLAPILSKERNLVA